MIAFLRGKLEKKTEEFIWLEVKDIGFQLYISSFTYEKLPDIGEELKLYTWMSTAMYGGSTFYGFLTTQEKEIFLLLNSISKIGPKDSLKILSKISSSLADFKKAIIEKDLRVLTTFFGLTKKKAERIILGLKDKITALEIESPYRFIFKDKQCMMDAVSALLSLGYKNREAEEAVNMAIESLGKEEKVEKIIKHALKYL